MTAQELLKINQNMKVALLDEEDDDDWYASSVQDIGSNDFCISVPLKAAWSLQLFKGDRVKVKLVTELVRYEFTTEVLGQREDNIPMFVLAIPEECTRIQLRNFVRVSVISELDYAPLPLAGQQPYFKRTTGLDLSGGGMRFLTPDKSIDTGTKLIIRFILPLKEGPIQMEVVGVVVRGCIDAITGAHQVAVKFVRIDRRQEDIITGYLLKKMSEQRRLS